MTEIRSQRVALRGKRLEDAPEDYAWRTDEELSRLDAAPPLRMPYEEFLRALSGELRYSVPWSKRFAIDTLEGKHIGNCMYYDIDTVRGEAELGIMIGEREYWSQGYGTEAVTCLLDHIFLTTPLRRIYLHTLDWNLRAQRCFEKCGFRAVRKVRRMGYNFILMEQLRDEWEARQLRDVEEGAEPDSRGKGQVE